MAKTYDFLKKVGTYFLATVDGDTPRVRPFGTFHEFEGKYYLQTGKSKDVSKQLHANPKVELSAFDGEKWIRVQAKAVLDNRIEVQESLLIEYSELKALYKAGDGNTETWYLSEATATISSFTEAPEVEKF